MPELFDILRQFYDYVHVEDVADIPHTWTSIAHLITPDRQEGLYEVGVFGIATYATSSRSLFARWSVDGGVTWREYSKEPKDATDMPMFGFQWPIAWPGGVFDFRFEARKENSSAPRFDINDVVLSFRRVG